MKRVRQVDPYIVVDAAWVEDEAEDEPAVRRCRLTSGLPWIESTWLSTG